MKTLITASLIAFASLGTVSVQAAGDHVSLASNSYHLLLIQSYFPKTR